MIGEYLPKVTAFVTRQGAHGTELLLFKHPNAAIQLPAGTITGLPAESASIKMPELRA